MWECKTTCGNITRKKSESLSVRKKSFCVAGYECGVFLCVAFKGWEFDVFFFFFFIYFFFWVWVKIWLRLNLYNKNRMNEFFFSLFFFGVWNGVRIQNSVKKKKNMFWQWIKLIQNGRGVGFCFCCNKKIDIILLLREI